jgi:hypothetical protein
MLLLRSPAVEAPSIFNGAARNTQLGSSSSKVSRSGSSLGTLKSEKATFLALHGKQYGYDGWLDRNWQREVGDRLGSTLRHYIDFTGGCIGWIDIKS